MSAPHAMKLPEGIKPPEGYCEVSIDKGPNTGRWAVLPNPKCAYCMSDPGFMSIAVGKQKKFQRQLCGCVMNRLADFLNREQRQPMQLAARRAPTKVKGKTHAQVMLDHLDEALLKMRSYVQRQEALISQLQVERTEAIAKVHAEYSELLRVHQELSLDVGNKLSEADTYEQHAKELLAQAAQLRAEVQQLEAHAKELGIPAVQAKLNAVLEEHDAKVELAMSDGQLRRYRHRVEQLAKKREQLVKLAVPVALALTA